MLDNGEMCIKNTCDRCFRAVVIKCNVFLFNNMDTIIHNLGTILELYSSNTQHTIPTSHCFLIMKLEPLVPSE